MKTLVLSMLMIIGTQAAMAGCMEDFRFLQDKKKVTLKFQRELELKKANEIKILREAEKKAVLNYMSYQNFKFDGSNSLFVKTEQYQEKKTNNSSVGYKISVTDGGDESNVRYYIKIDVGMEDVAYPILMRYWDNQSPERDFLCETY